MNTDILRHRRMIGCIYQQTKELCMYVATLDKQRLAITQTGKETFHT